MLEQLRAKFPGLQITPSYLFDRQVISNQKDSYRFSLRGQNRTNERPLVLLQDTDVSIPLRWKFGLQKEADNKPGSSPLYTFPNVAVFGAQAPDLMSFFWGEISLKIGDTVIFDPAPAQQFYHVPELLQRPAVASVEGAIAFDSLNEGSGLHELESMPVLNGKQSIELTTSITMMDGMNIQAGAGSKHFWAVYMRVLKVSGGAEQHYKAISEAVRSLMS